MKKLVLFLLLSVVAVESGYAFILAVGHGGVITGDIERVD